MKIKGIIIKLRAEKKVFSLISGTMALIVFLSGCMPKQESKRSNKMADLKDSASYAYGYFCGLKAKYQDQVPLNAESFSEGFQKGYQNDSSAMFSQDECNDILEKYYRETQQEFYNQEYEKARPMIDLAESFLKENITKEGVKQTPEGLQYKIIKQGKGVKPIKGHGDRIRFKWELSVLDKDGKEQKIESDFDNPHAQWRLQGIDNYFEGFAIAAQMMNSGSIYKIWVHPNLGYGLYDSVDIPAGSLLIITIEVDEVLPS